MQPAPRLTARLLDERRVLVRDGDVLSFVFGSGASGSSNQAVIDVRRTARTVGNERPRANPRNARVRACLGVGHARGVARLASLGCAGTRDRGLPAWCCSLRHAWSSRPAAGRRAPLSETALSAQGGGPTPAQTRSAAPRRGRLQTTTTTSAECGVARLASLRCAGTRVRGSAQRPLERKPEEALRSRRRRSQPTERRPPTHGALDLAAARPPKVRRRRPATCSYGGRPEPNQSFRLVTVQERDRNLIHSPVLHHNPCRSRN